jgi:hypothetical protein
VNCRRTRSLLSAYVDAELTGFDMLQIRDHISRCGDCGSEHESLLSVKRILSSLPDKQPSPEFIFRLQNVSPRNTLDDLFVRIVPMWLMNVTSAAVAATMPTGGRRVATACLFSLVGIWFMVAPTANAPQAQMLAKSPSRAIRLLNAVGFSSPYSFSGWRSASLNPAIVDPMGRPVAPMDARWNQIDLRTMNQTRMQSFMQMMRPRFNMGMSTQSSSSGFGGSNVFLTGYSEGAR